MKFNLAKLLEKVKITINIISIPNQLVAFKKNKLPEARN